MGGYNGTQWFPTTSGQLGAQTRTTKTVTTEREFDEEERLVKETITETTETVTDHAGGYPHYTYTTTNVAGTNVAEK